MYNNIYTVAATLAHFVEHYRLTCYGLWFEKNR